MTIEKLWNNLEPLVGKVSNIEEQITKMQTNYHEMNNKIDNLQTNYHEMNNKIDNLQTNYHEMNNKIDNLQTNYHEINDKIKDLQTNYHEMNDKIKDLQTNDHKIENNMTSMMNYQIEMQKIIKNINEKLDKYIIQNEVEHKKFEYQIANLEWKTKTSN